jgi:hypothetical protein
LLPEELEVLGDDPQLFHGVASIENDLFAFTQRYPGLQSNCAVREVSPVRDDSIASCPGRSQQLSDDFDRPATNPTLACLGARDTRSSQSGCGRVRRSLTRLVLSRGPLCDAGACKRHDLKTQLKLAKWAEGGHYATPSIQD